MLKCVELRVVLERKPSAGEKLARSAGLAVQVLEGIVKELYIYIYIILFLFFFIFKKKGTAVGRCGLSGHSCSQSRRA